MGLTPVLRLALASLWNRRVSAFLTVLAIALSVMLFLGVDKLRKSAQTSFETTISETDLIVAARTSPISVLLFSVFHIGDPAAVMSWQSFNEISDRKDIAWSVPISLGDSHRGYRVVGTNEAFFERYKYGRGRDLQMADGDWFDDLYDAVIGSELAKELGYVTGQEITLSHGTGRVSFMDHDNRPFRISGVIARTGTPVDKSVFVSLAAIEAIHVGWQSGAPSPIAKLITSEQVRGMNLTPKTVSAAFVGLENPRTLLSTKRAIDTNASDALVAVQPGRASAELWNIIGVVEQALLGISAFVILVGLVSILTSLLTSLQERRREMAVLRAVGARPVHIFLLLIFEAMLLALLGAIMGIAIVHLALALAGPVFGSQFGLTLPFTWPGQIDLVILLAVTGMAGVLGLVPAFMALRQSLADGLSVRS